MTYSEAQQYSASCVSLIKRSFSDEQMFASYE